MKQIKGGSLSGGAANWTSTSTSTGTTASGGSSSQTVVTSRGSDGSSAFEYASTIAPGTTKGGMLIRTGSSGPLRTSSGSGTSHGSAYDSVTTTGTETYSEGFHDGLGTLTGTRDSDSHDQWNYEFDQTYTYVSGGATGSDGWVMTETGSGSADGHSHVGTAGSGSYSSGGSVTVTDTINGLPATGTNTFSQSGSLDQSSEQSGSYDSTFSWTDSSWTVTENWGGSSSSDSHDHRGTTLSVDSKIGDFGAGAGSFFIASGGTTVDETTHAESASGGVGTASSDATSGLTWTATSGGSGASWREIIANGHHNDDWGRATGGTPGSGGSGGGSTGSGSTSKVETGSSSFADQRHDKWTETSGHSRTASSDGASTTTVSGSHGYDWNFQFHGSGRIKGVRTNTVRHSGCCGEHFIYRGGTLFAQGAT